MGFPYSFSIDNDFRGGDEKVIEKLTSLNITQEMFNGTTKFQQVSVMNQQPYEITGIMIVFGIMAILWFISGFLKVTSGSRKIAFETWIHRAMAVIIMIGALLYILIFIFPVFTYWV